MRVAELLATEWGFSELYLHAALSKDWLLDFYEAQQYEQLPDLDQPDWVIAFAGREQTRYFCKELART